jgi:hypothetical protein
MGATLRQRLGGLATPFGAPGTQDSPAPAVNPSREKK